MQYDLKYNITALAFLVLLTISFFRTKRFPNKANRTYGLVLVITFFCVSFDCLTAYTISFPYLLPVWSNYVLNIFFFIMHTSLGFLALIYVLLITDNNIKPLKRFPIIVFSAFYILLVLLILTTMFHHGIFYFDRNRTYTHGKLYVPYFIILSSFLITGSIYSIARRNFLQKDQRLTIPIYTAILIGANIIQFRTPSIFINGVSVILAEYMMYITLQNPSEYFDQTTGLYSRYALDTYMEDCIHDKKQFQVVMVNMKHTNAINKALGITFTNQILRELAATLAAIAGKKNLCFNVTGDIAVILTHEEKEHKRIYEKLHTAFPSIMEIEHKKVEVELHLGSIDTLEGLSNTSEFHEMLRLCNIMSRDKNSKKELTTAELTGIKKYQKAEKNLKDALLFKQILLTLQPIYNSQTKKIIGAEALARIENEKGQLLQPASFIPIAEDNGLVTELDMQIFANACEALKKINRTNADFTVSVNLAAIDFLSDKIVERIFQIIDKYDIDTQKLVIELTETGASISPMILQVMQRLKAKGIRLAIDDFGIGFANYDAILRLPVDFIKIDRNLLLLCQEQPKYQVILEHLAIALKQVGRLVLIEGIETPEQATLASKMGICLQQGFLYGKPDSIDKMLQLLQ